MPTYAELCLVPRFFKCFFKKMQIFTPNKWLVYAVFLTFKLNLSNLLKPFGKYAILKCNIIK